MNRQPDWYAKRIADEVRYFAMQADASSEDVARDAIAKARKDSREHPEAGEPRLRETEG